MPLWKGRAVRGLFVGWGSGMDGWRGDLRGPAVSGRPLRSMSPGIRLRRIPPPLLTRKGLPDTAGLGFGYAEDSSACGAPSRVRGASGLDQATRGPRALSASDQSVATWAMPVNAAA